MNLTERQPHFNRRVRTKKEIKQLIAERNNVLTQFYNLSNHASIKDGKDIDTLLEIVQEFCQDMIDYIATGHFEIYRRIEEGCERRTEMLELSDRVFDELSNTTKVAIEFNDLYDVPAEFGREVLQNLTTQLSELGENLAIRIELEDQFINTLLSHKTKQAYVVNLN